MKKYLGIFYAFLAAIFGALIGVSSVKVMNSGLHPFETTFYKCLIALIIVTLWIIISGLLKAWLGYLQKNYKPIAICAFFEFFVVLFFETNAFFYEKVSVVAFLLLGSATISGFILSAILNKKFLSNREILSMSLALFGLAIFFGLGRTDLSAINYKGSILAIISGCGYGAFLALSSHFKIGSSSIVLNSLLLFGTFYLLLPCLTITLHIPDLNNFYLLLIMAILPTIGGCWLLIKAITLIKSNTVQLIQLGEPIFASFLAFIFLSQELNTTEIIGAILIISAIYVNCSYKSN